ncbi:hypothetical protein [Arachidicoccus sp.]|uniref:hypothetical protein n=1 Tax=Arachidicoccus sp. TaxID=1872624 RepID=UPI003D1AC936
MKKEEGFTIFSERFQNLYNCLCEIRDSKEDWRYKIIHVDNFAKHKNPIEAAADYWKEILYRAHLAVLVTYFKTIRWIDAVKDAKENSNYYSFVASLRGFIECCSDSFYSLNTVPLTIAKDFEVISRQLSKTSGVITDHQSLEELLIHFSHATKLGKEQKNIWPEFLNAKQIREYLNSISDVGDKIDFLYSYLCQVVHPASQSADIILFHSYENEMIVCGDSFQLEKELINIIDVEFAEVIHNTFTIICTNGFTILKLLKKFHLPELHTSFTFEDTVEDIDAWQEILDLIAKSKMNYDLATVSGVYQ